MNFSKSLQEAWTGNCYICIVHANTPFDKHSDQLVDFVSEGIAIFNTGAGNLNVNDVKYLFLVDDGHIDEDFQRRLHKVVIPLLSARKHLCCIYLRENSKCILDSSYYESGCVREIKI